MKSTILASIALVVSVSAAQGQSHPCASGKKTEATISIVDDRRQIFKLETSELNFALAGLGTSDLAKVVKAGAHISIFGANQKPDRYNIVDVHVWLGNPRKWLQGQLLENGQAIFDGLQQNHTPDCLEAMRGAEKAAIEEKAGYWAKKDAILKSTSIIKLQQKTGHFVVVDGKVLSIGDRKRRLYLNFGQNWSQDFTLSVVKEGKGAFKGSLNLLKNLQGKTVRVRGVLEQRQGPLIRLFDETQIELIDD